MHTSLPQAGWRAEDANLQLGVLLMHQAAYRLPRERDCEADLAVGLHNRCKISEAGSVSPSDHPPKFYDAAAEVGGVIAMELRELPDAGNWLENTQVWSATA
jgi:hypothetical protein